MSIDVSDWFVSEYYTYSEAFHQQRSTPKEIKSSLISRPVMSDHKHWSFEAVCEPFPVELPFDKKKMLDSR